MTDIKHNPKVMKLLEDLIQMNKQYDNKPAKLLLGDKAYSYSDAKKEIGKLTETGEQLYKKIETMYQQTHQQQQKPEYIQPQRRAA